MFANAPPTDEGSIRPMLVSVGVRRRSHRDNTRPDTSVRPNVSVLPLESAMQNDHHSRLAVRMNWRPRISWAGRRFIATSHPSCCMARRASGAFVVDGSGAPKATVTGYGMRTGHLWKNVPPLKLKLLPQTRSR